MGISEEQTFITLAFLPALQNGTSVFHPNCNQLHLLVFPASLCISAEKGNRSSVHVGGALPLNKISPAHYKNEIL